MVPWTQPSLPGFSRPLALESGRSLSLAEVRSLSPGDHTPGKADHWHFCFIIALRLTQRRIPQHLGVGKVIRGLLKSDKCHLSCASAILRVSIGPANPWLFLGCPSELESLFNHLDHFVGQAATLLREYENLCPKMVKEGSCSFAFF